MAEIITHAFVSAKSQSPDTTLVSKNEWNDGHVLTGGINGQFIVYDNTQQNNIRWTDGPVSSGNTALISTSTATPLANLAPVTITPASFVVVVVSFAGLQYTSVGAATGALELQLNGATVSVLSLVSGNLNQSLTFTHSLIPGSYTYSLRLTTTGNVNVTLINTLINIFSIGA